MRSGLIVWHSSASSAFFTRLYSYIHSIYIEHSPLVNTVVIRSMPFLQCFLREGPKQTISSKFIQFRHLELLRDESLPLPLLPVRRCARDAYSARRTTQIYGPKECYNPPSRPSQQFGGENPKIHHCNAHGTSPGPSTSLLFSVYRLKLLWISHLNLHRSKGILQ